MEEILKQNLNGERCAIQRYEEIANFTNSKDHSTYQMAITILGDEIEHENDIEAFLADIERLKEDIRQFRM